MLLQKDDRFIRMPFLGKSVSSLRVYSAVELKEFIANLKRFDSIFEQYPGQTYSNAPPAGWVYDEENSPYYQWDIIKAEISGPSWKIMSIYRAVYCGRLVNKLYQFNLNPRARGKQILKYDTIDDLLNAHFKHI